MNNAQAQPSDPSKYTLSNTNLLESASFTAPIIAVIPANALVQVVDSAEDWYLVTYDDQTGYVPASSLSTTKYTWLDVLLRSYPSAESNPIASLPPKSEVEVLSVTGAWSLVMYNSVKGYIFNYFLTDDGNPPAEYDYTYFNTNMTRFVNENNIQSPTVNLITTDLENKITYVFEKVNDGSWKLLYQWLCTVGKPSTPTIQGTFYVSGRKPYFGTDNYRAKYATRIKGSYYYHTVLFNAAGTEVIDDRLGVAISHGCIRLAVENAQWIYDNVLDASAIVIH
ncbi:SH3 domain-containing protein [Niameybacter massiliensis]|uniref:SH3 domain-containing protein n=1 Tax=Holtiella tumoricola TaxID=3018743 RepID=A0AA42J0F5_9FIRM|nr:SH3 domain-containing protein [Holtiella tumoricola]MDA3731073.1 SH3 domain-containing protein [Holtiella tumoricola]